MKKITFILFFLVLISCSKEEPIDTLFSPPSWIQGEWILTSSQSVPRLPEEMEFTKDDFIKIYNNSDGQYRESQNWFFSLGKLYSPTEQFSSNNYVIILHYVLADNIYDFTYISDSEIRGSFENPEVDDNYREFILTRR